MPRQTGPKRNKGERERDLPIIADMYVKGKSQRYIAAWLNENREYNLSRITIRNDINKVRDEWLQSAVVDYDEAKARELAKVDKIEDEAWQAWERSVGVSETETQMISRSGGEETEGGQRKATIKRENKVGDPRFLSTVQWCITKRCEILGLDAPKKQEFSTPEGRPIEISSESKNRIDLSHLSKDKLKILRELIGQCNVCEPGTKEPGPTDS